MELNEEEIDKVITRWINSLTATIEFLQLDLDDIEESDDFMLSELDPSESGYFINPYSCKVQKIADHDFDLKLILPCIKYYNRDSSDRTVKISSILCRYVQGLSYMDTCHVTNPSNPEEWILFVGTTVDDVYSDNSEYEGMNWVQLITSLPGLLELIPIRAIFG